MIRSTGLYILIIWTVALSLVSVVSCDPFAGQRIILQNSTDERVHVDLDLSLVQESTPIPVEPGDVERAAWVLVPSQTIHRTIKAFDENSHLIFCQDFTYSYETAGREILEVEIVKGHLPCLQED